MASFSIDIGDAGSSYEQGVAMPSATEGKAIAQGLSNLSSNIFGALDDVAEARQRGQPTESEIKRQAYSSFIEDIDLAKGVKGPQATVIVNSALAEYERLGFEVGAAEAAAVKRRTGIDIDYLAFDVEQEAMNTSMKKLAENPGYLQVARNKLEQQEKPYTEQDVTELALSDMLRVEAASVSLAISTSIAEEDFGFYVENADIYLDNLRALTVQGLKVELDGGNVSPESIVQLRTKFDMVKSQLTRPPMINENLWKASVQDKVDALGDLLTSLESYDQRQIERTSAEILEVTSVALLKIAKDQTESDPILAKALLSDDIDWSGYVAENYTKLIKSLKSIEPKYIKYTDLTVFPELLKKQEKGDKKAIDKQLKTDDLHSQEELDSTSDMSFSVRKNAVDTTLGLKVNMVNKGSLGKAEHQDNFFAGIGKVTSLMATTQELFSTETLNRLYNDELYEKLKFVKNLKPEEHGLAVERLKDVLQSQYNVYSSTAAGSLTDSFFNITGLGKVEYDLDRRTMEGSFTMGSEARDLVKFFASKHYNGDVTAMVADRGMRLDTRERNDIEKTGFKFSPVYRKYREIQRIASGTKIYINNMKKLGMDTKAIEQTMIKPVQVGKEPAEIEGEINGESQKRMFEEETTNISVFGSNIGIDEETYNKLPSGTLYTVGNDATVRRKK
jgi:hypothetical protein